MDTEVRDISWTFDQATIEDLRAVENGSLGAHRVNVTLEGGGMAQFVVFAVQREGERTHAARGLSAGEKQWLADCVLPCTGLTSYGGEVSPAEAGRLIYDYENSAA